MNIITFPTVAPAGKMTWKLKRFDTRFTSPLSGTFQDIQRPGAQWQCELSWEVLAYADAQALAAWSDQMSQAGTRTFLPDYTYRMQGVPTGTPAINGSGQTGATLALSGFTASSSNVFCAGDLIQVSTSTQHQLVRVTANASANSSGDATLSITPALRFSPTALNYTNPDVCFAFANAESAMSFTAPLIGSFSISLLEDITQ